MSPFTALVRKEVRTLAPALSMAVAMWGGFLWVDALLDGFVDMQGFARMFDAFADPDFHYWAMAMLALAAGQSLIAAERSQGTLELLDALPVTRGRVFLGKATGGWLVLCAGPLSSLATILVLHSVSRDSRDPSMHLRLLLTAFAFACLQAAVLLALALLLSFAGRFGWLLAFLWFLAVALLAKEDPRWDILDAAQLTKPVLTGLQWAPAWRLVAVQCALAAAWGGLAALLFRGGGERLLAGVESAVQSRLGRVAAVAGGVAVVVVFLVVIGLSASDDDEKTPPPVFARISTDAYVFTFPSAKTQAARALASRADGAADTVCAFLGVDRRERIAVNATGLRATAQASGQAAGKAIQMHIGTGADSDLGTLAHETVHVYADVLSDRRLQGSLFVEGLANYVELRFFGDDDERRASRLRAAVLKARGEVELERLYDEIDRRWHFQVAYDVGEVLFAALVEAHGDEAPGHFLRALARKDASRSLSGLARVREAFRECGYDFADVERRFDRILDDTARPQREVIDRLPRVRAAVVQERGRIGIRPSWTRPAEGSPGRPYCWVRRAGTTDRTEYYFPDETNGVYWVDRSFAPAGTLEYECGAVHRAPLRLWLPEPWQESRVP